MLELVKPLPAVNMFILANDFIVIGTCSDDVDTNYAIYYLDNAALLQNVGSTLGDITIAGPNVDTHIIPCGNMYIFADKIVAIIECKASNWVEPLGYEADSDDT